MIGSSLFLCHVMFVVFDLCYSSEVWCEVLGGTLWPTAHRIDAF